MEKKLYYNFYWTRLPEDIAVRFIREFQDHGINDFVLTDTLLNRMIEDPAVFKFLEKCCQCYGITFGAAHAPCGDGKDLNVDEHDEMIKHHIAALEYCGRIGVKTYTVHPGVAMYCYHDRSMELLRERTVAALEKLLPVAEKNNIIIAVENSFEPTNSPHEVMYYVNKFISSPNIGVCFDTGHANIMAALPGKNPELYPDYHHANWSRFGGIKEEEDALGILFDQVVTTHIHDNDSYADLHGMPGDGTIDWKKMVQRLKSCPRMVEYQTEVCYDSGDNWAGHLLAPEGGYTVKRITECFRELGF